MNSQVADLVGDRDGGRASTPPLTPLPIPLTKDHHCCKKTAHGRRSRFLHKLLRGNDGNRVVGEPKYDCPAGMGAHPWFELLSTTKSNSQMAARRSRNLPH